MTFKRFIIDVLLYFLVVTFTFIFLVSFLEIFRKDEPQSKQTVIECQPGVGVLKKEPIND